MFYKLFALFAVLAVAFAAPKPEPKPQYLTYSPGLDYLSYGSAALPPVVSAYSAPALTPFGYSAYPHPVFVFLFAIFAVALARPQLYSGVGYNGYTGYPGYGGYTGYSNPLSYPGYGAYSGYPYSGYGYGSY